MKHSADAARGFVEISTRSLLMLIMLSQDFLQLPTPLKFNIETKKDGPWKMYLLSNMAILDIDLLNFQWG